MDRKLPKINRKNNPKQYQATQKCNFRTLGVSVRTPRWYLLHTQNPCSALNDQGSTSSWGIFGKLRRACVTVTITRALNTRFGQVLLIPLRLPKRLNEKEMTLHGSLPKPHRLSADKDCATNRITKLNFSYVTLFPICCSFVFSPVLSAKPPQHLSRAAPKFPISANPVSTTWNGLLCFSI